MVELTVDRTVSINPIVTIVISREITSAIPFDTCPIKAITHIVTSRHIFDDNIISQHLKAIVEFVLTIQDHCITIAATDRNTGGFYSNSFMVCTIEIVTWAYRDKISWDGRIYRCLYCGVLLWYL